jgi:peptide/nickel transport system permease protein
MSILTRRRDRIDDLAATSGGDQRGRSISADAVRRLMRSPTALFGAAIVLVFILVAIFAPLLAPKDPYFRYLIDDVRQNSPLPARAGYPLGADQNGRDVLSRLIVASRQSLLVGVAATVAGLSVGMLLGGVAGALGGWIDTVLMRFVPSLLLAISIAALFAKANQWTVIVAVAIVSVPIFARLLRGAMLAQRHSEYVLAARALGVRERAIVLRHMLPNSLSAVIVQATLTLATSIIDAAALSFLGLGDADPNRAEWGAMLGDAQRYFDIQPSLAVWPALCIIVVALGFTLFGESLREALDPKNRR